MVRANQHYEALGFVNVKQEKMVVNQPLLNSNEEDLLDPFLLTDPFDVTYQIIWEKNLLQQH